MEKFSSAALKDFCMAMPICKAELSISVKMLQMQYRNLMDTDSMRVQYRTNSRTWTIPIEELIVQLDLKEQVSIVHLLEH